jgi:hypothetical protein
MEAKGTSDERDTRDERDEMDERLREVVGMRGTGNRGMRG